MMIYLMSIKELNDNNIVENLETDHDSLDGLRRAADSTIGIDQPWSMRESEAMMGIKK